ncbi:P-loop containing nucleoside triphosphate hydrolases superfamily protein isoform 1 [Hibiscus syriacus]|uniref:P-loop containing nucleoside triphosphate hydrolases superfamily protein isoform 1 n=1 Tax=Hibiscus syriacus TaxID=106335 RepID=A0A6A2ZYA2_HIBSY|nr:P-loop containing nucleoside triphosphate hydrolases superfamily protein isoform 1 [Hibiscus syriacus]
MATSTIASKPARLLGELLQEQQEPFALEVYLSEKGCGTKNLTSIHGHGSSGKFLKKSGTGSNKIKRSKGIPNFLKVLKIILCNKFFTIRGTENSLDEYGDKQETAVAGRYSSGSCSALYKSSSDSDTDEASMFTDNPKPSELHTERAAVDTKFQLSACIEDSKQHSPQSVLESVSTSTVSNTRQKSLTLPKLITEESILSAALWSLLHQTAAKEQTGCEGLKEGNGSPFSVSKRFLQQTRQLLLDCVRELIDHNKERFLGTEEIGNIICEKIREWGKPSGDEGNTKETLELDVMVMERWNDFEIESGKREMGLLLGNAIVDEITSEVVMDMINTIV